MMAANGDGEQQRAVDLPFAVAFDQADPGRRRADQRAGAIDTMTRTGSQTMRPWTSKAAMPV